MLSKLKELAVNNVALDASGVGSVPEFWTSTSKVKRDFMFPFRSPKTTVCMFGSIDAFGTLMKAMDHSSHRSFKYRVACAHTHIYTALHIISGASWICGFSVQESVSLPRKFNLQ